MVKLEKFTQNHEISNKKNERRSIVESPICDEVKFQVWTQTIPLSQEWV